jgi:tetratricopeptide (TPR) repeat protein
VARAANNVAALHHALGRYALAEESYRRALGWHRQYRPVPDMETAAVLNNLAATLRAQARLDEAAALAKEAVAIAGPAGGGIAAARFLFTLAEIERSRGRGAEVEAHVRRALDLTDDGLLRAHLNQSLAAQSLQDGDTERAERLQREAVSLFQSNLTAPHPHLASAASNLAEILTARGQHAAARELLESALLQWRRTLGADHPNAAVALNNLGQWHARMGQTAEAENLLREAIRTWEAAYGPGHPDIARAQINLGALFEAAGKLSGAEKLYRRSFERMERAYGLSHPATVQAATALARVWDRQRRTTEARAFRLRTGIAQGDAR